MSTTALNSPLAKACTILSLLVCVRTLPAADSARSRTKAQDQTSAYAEGGVHDPCAVGQITQSDAGTAGSSDTAISLAKLMSRTKNQAKSLQTGPNQGGTLTRDLWSNRVAAPEQGKEAEASLALRRLVRQVRSMKFEDQNPGPTFTPPAESLPSDETLETQLAEMNATGSTPTAVATPAAAASGASPSTKVQKTLGILQQNADQIQDPLEMAELLFLSGRPAEAAPFYAKALDGLSRTDPTYEADRAWVLFQLGNSLRETDIVKAQEAYMKLVSEYPASPWTELAKAHGRLLTWYQKSRPEQTTTPQL
ncbi:MAG: tetratricopeptide repeat protein [Phycisphaerales bacterium]